MKSLHSFVIKGAAVETFEEEEEEEATRVLALILIFFIH